MGMFYLAKRLADLNLSSEYAVSSAALETSTTGEDMYGLSKEQLDKHMIPYGVHYAHKITMQEILNADYVLVMERYQKIDLKRMMSGTNVSKIHCLLEFTDDNRDIADPFYTRDFETAYLDIAKGVEGFINKEILTKTE